MSHCYITHGSLAPPPSERYFLSLNGSKAQTPCSASCFLRETLWAYVSIQMAASESLWAFIYQIWGVGSSLCRRLTSSSRIRFLSNMAGGGGGGWLPLMWTDARATFKHFLFMLVRWLRAAAAPPPPPRTRPHQLLIQPISQAALFTAPPRSHPSTARASPG